MGEVHRHGGPRVLVPCQGSHEGSMRGALPQGVRSHFSYPNYLSNWI